MHTLRAKATLKAITARLEQCISSLPIDVGSTGVHNMRELSQKVDWAEEVYVSIASDLKKVSRNTPEICNQKANIHRRMEALKTLLGRLRESAPPCGPLKYDSGWLD